MEKVLTNACPQCLGRGLRPERASDGARSVSCRACFGTGKDTSEVFRLTDEDMHHVLAMVEVGALHEVVRCHHTDELDTHNLYKLALQKETGEVCAYVCCRTCRDMCLSDLAWLPGGAPWIQ